MAQQKRYHKQELKALTDSMYKYPYLNLSLVDMDSEKWKDLPGYEGYYMVSDKGRVKTMPRDIAHRIGKHFISHRTDEKIIKQSIYKTNNRYRDEHYEALIFRTTVGNLSKTQRVARCIYEAFVGPVPRGMFVLHKGDPLDNSVENLYAATKKELANFQKERNKDAINARGGLFAEKEVSQYDPEGNYLATFKSIKQAAETTGIDGPGITEVVNGKRITAKGYFWRQGNDQTKLDVAAIYKKAKDKQLTSAKVHSKRIVQYSLEGEYLNTFESIKAAMEKTGLSREAIAGVLYGNRYLSREFIWKYADSFKDGEIPSRIIADEYKLPEPAQTANKRKGKQFPRYDYPYQDMFLYDLDEESWKEVPGLENYCMVSNLGRVKSLPRFVDRPNHGRYLLKEKIIKQHIRTVKENHWTGIQRVDLYFSIGIEGQACQMSVTRAVYAAFVNPRLDFKEDKTFILHKDLNNLNNRVENLYMATRQQMGKRNVKEGMMRPPDVSEFTDELWEKIRNIRIKAVSQYSHTGKFIATYPSITEATRATGASKGGIVRVARETERHAAGFIWRFGSDTKDLDMETLQKYDRKKHFRARTVNRYDLNGRFLDSFESITEAARRFGYSRRTLNSHILMQTPEFNGYVWRFAQPDKDKTV